MEKISSRKNAYIAHIRALASDADCRRGCGEFLCSGIKTLREALAAGAEVTSVLWNDFAQTLAELDGVKQYIAPTELFDYASPLKSSPGPLFSVHIAPVQKAPIREAIVLEGVQDPGNVGTVVRTANALGVDAVILTGDCADLYNFKTVRATMGAIFRQRVIKTELSGLKTLLQENALPLYGAALRSDARDIRQIALQGVAVAVGSEGSGLSEELLAQCDATLIIPMTPQSESLNAANAAAIIMWELRGRFAEL